MARVYKALYAFEAVEADELALMVGDVVDVSIVHPGEWGVGKSRRTNKEGSFPWSYVEEITPPEPSADEAPPPIVPRSLKPKTLEPSQPAPPPRPVGGFGRGQAENLSQYAWFAGEMDRATAEQRLSDRADGSFLVRVSQSRAGYSLTVKFTEIRHVVIVESAGKFGFSEPTIFDSLSALISHFEKESLSCYNAELETCLRYPYVDAPKETQDDSRYDDMDEELYISNVHALRESLEKKANKLPKPRTAAAYSKRVKELQNNLKAQDVICNMLREQKKSHEWYQQNIDPNQRDAFMENYWVLSARLDTAEKALQALEADLNREKEAEDRMREEEEATKTTAERLDSTRRPNKGLVICSVSRIEAENLLKGHPTGTYIVRYGNRVETPYTLSLRYSEMTKHIQIKHDGSKYGLAEPLTFPTLESLCEFYKGREISQSILTPLIKAVSV